MRRDDVDAASMGCIVLAAMMPLAMVLRGWVLSIVWRWFVVSQFHIMGLTIPAAIGLSIVICMFTDKSASSEPKSTGATVTSIVGRAAGTLLVGPLLTLGLAWIVRYWL